MRVFHCFLRALTLCLILTGPASAGCAALLQSIELAVQNFASDTVKEPSSLNQLNRMIHGINNDDLLMILRASGQASAFGDLRNFLTQLKFISEATNRDTFQFTPSMEQDLGRAQGIAQRACGAAAGIEVEAGATATGQGNDGQSAQGQSLGIGSQRTSMLSPAQQAYLEESFNFTLLGRLIFGMTLSVLAVLSAHYGLVLYQVLRRNRRICEIPAEFLCMMNEVPGNLTVLGRRGCIFLPASPDEAREIDGVTKGTYCTLRIDDIELSAKLLHDVSTECRMLFATPISPHLMKTLLSQSEKPVRYDFSVMKGRTGSLRRFGTGSMPSAS